LRTHSKKLDVHMAASSFIRDRTADAIECPRAWSRGVLLTT
jgi:hypothetical protein